MNTIDFSPEELTAFREEMFQGFTDTQFNLAIAECKRRNLVPGQHVYFQLRNSSEWSAEIGAKVSTKKLTKVTTIDAFRLISQRTGEYTGQGKAKFYYLDEKNAPTIVSEIPLPHPTVPNTPREPWACSVPIYRKGFEEPVEVVCRFDAYAVTRRAGNTTVLTDMWVRRGPEQLSKCSEAASRRVAFAEELGSMYLSEEFAREDAENKAPEPVATEAVVAAPKAPTVPKVNHTPAVASDAPRPGADKTLVEVILDKPAVPVETVQKMDKPEKPKKLTAKEKTNAALEADHEDMLAAIDGEIAKNQDPDARLPNDDEKKENSARIRALIELGLSASEKTLLQKFVEAGRPLTEKLQSDWKKVLTQLEAAGTKEAVLQLIAVQPLEEEF
jgi:hypothetical protein